MLGSTGFLGWAGCAVLAAGLALLLPAASKLSRVLDALVLGEDSARSLGLNLPRLRLLLVGLLAAATGPGGVADRAGGLRRPGRAAPGAPLAPGPHGYTLWASAAAGGVLLLAADIGARSLIAPQELPVGVLTAVLGGAYLLWLLHRQGEP